MPLKIITKDKKRIVVCQPTPTKIGTRVPPGIRMADEVYPEMQQIQDALMSKRRYWFERKQA